MTPSTNSDHRRVDLIVVGGGLAGLSAAALVARAGRSVVVLERSKGLGGRASTHVREGIYFNLGPHALYRSGHAFRLLGELGVPFTGRVPNPGQGLLVDGAETFPLSLGLGALVATRMFGIREKLRLVRILATLNRLDTRGLDHTPLGDWVEATAGPGPGRLAAFLRTLVRISTYVDDHRRLSAGASLDQLKTALAGNVWYLDGGWQTLVDGLRNRAGGWGAEFRTGSRAESVQIDRDGDGVSVRLIGGEVLWGRTAILAVEPEEACTLLDLPADASLPRWGASRIPVRAACLDVALTHLPRPANRAAFGLDRPLYLSVHSAAARLAPEGVAVLHVMKYLGGDSDTPAGGVEAELEAYLDRIQPGWRTHVVTRRFLPGMTVTHALPRAEEGGLQGRAGVALPERPGVFLAGDWVGTRGMLTDASAASAEEAARGVLNALTEVPVRPERSLSHVAG